MWEKVKRPAEQIDSIIDLKANQITELVDGRASLSDKQFHAGLRKITGADFARLTENSGDGRKPDEHLAWVAHEVHRTVTNAVCFDKAEYRDRLNQHLAGAVMSKHVFLSPVEQLAESAGKKLKEIGARLTGWAREPSL